MTPKEKAEQLYLKFSFIDSNVDGKFDKQFHHDDVIECCNVFVDEILSGCGEPAIGYSFEYWQEVKVSINQIEL